MFRTFVITEIDGGVAQGQSPDDFACRLQVGPHQTRYRECSGAVDAMAPPKISGEIRSTGEILMAPRIEFRILGPFGMSVNGKTVPLPRGGQRILLGALLIQANEIVSNEELIGHIWGSALPHNPKGALHTCIARLRQTFARHGVDGDSAVIRTCTAAYVIDISPDRLDLLRFRSLVAAARCAADSGKLAAQSASLAQAVALWRGPVLSDVQSESLRRDIVHESTEQYLAALEALYNTELALGRHSDIIGPLRTLVCKHPFRERFHEQLMLALYRSDRQIEALETYQDVTVHMREELGVDPSPTLRELHFAILRQEPGLARLMQHG
ncbi:AfsR/SARP family transcriptional regulator [Streptomyces milbemycinicus]|uniref:BTAD domain-containing putative transcriptional regulator n=1 Tax=Streptomyces milbemycinicus TaxID=476552 RepID=A0ABW8LX32_9ACTN